MKYLLITVSVVLITACSVKKNSAAKETSEEVELAPIEEAVIVDDGLTDLAETFAKAIIDINPSLLVKYAPNASLARVLSPTATATKTDAEIEQEMLSDLKNRFELNFSRIQKALEENSVDRAVFKYESYKYYDSTDPETVPRVLEVTFLNGNKEVRIPLTVLKQESNWFVFEILNTTNLFK